MSEMMATAHAPARGEGSSAEAIRLEPKLHMQHERVNRGFLAEPERRALRWLVERTPMWVRPDHLTAIGVAGALLAMIGFICAHLSPYFVSIVIIGLVLNWYGDSLDGTLARYRRIERPHFGYFIDHSCDLISQTLIFVGFGFSPFFTTRSALIALSMYLLMSSYTYLKVMSLKTHQLSYGGMGATELRVAFACWSIAAAWTHYDPTALKILSYPVLDEVTGALCLIVFLGFVWMVLSDLSRFQKHNNDSSEIDGSATVTLLPRRPIAHPVSRAPER